MYRFEKPVSGGHALVKTLSGGVFSLGLGFKREAFIARFERLGHRERAQALLDRVSASLHDFEQSEGTGVKISVASIYGTTGELVLNVFVSDAARTEAVRDGLIEALSALPDVSFAGLAGRARVD